ncbi:hypothetical protein [Streptomyces fuscichromogenes]|uniref:Uncharacterized protein n=1 Tax=Streptomyces fuscichromogenes TaxID=1324013 RepID=A0A917XN16_9ACTN|nr:hypothetical protein [Streptomyces fuscichromogenes]GGN41107.1 hypothetical protein GCM10011578_089050 [Streptomyces fuscichromogenes]
MTLFGVEEVLPRGNEAELAGPRLREQVDQAADALSATVGEDPQALRGRLLKLVNLPRLSDTDDHDLREVLRELRVCEQEGKAAYRARLQRVTRVDRPAGIAQLPRPRSVKPASSAGACGLCADGYDVGDLIGRMPSPDELPYVPMGWLCWHCLVQRRRQPRRRDVLLRFFHALFAGDGVGLNGIECGLLLEWLTADPALSNSKPWKADPLENTVVRLRTSAADGKPTTWLSTQTVHTIVAVLREVPASPATTVQDEEALAALVQHLAEWETNPAAVPASRYGTGWCFRRQVLALTEHPTVLSQLGGPFFLYQCKTTQTGQLVEP